MSAFMVNNRTLTKIANYMAAFARPDNSKNYDLELEDNFKKHLSDKGLYDKEKGEFSKRLIHAYLYEKNREAMIARYGDGESIAECIQMEDEGTSIDLSPKTRKTWLSNLYTVCRCYLYQIEEGDYQNDEFFWLFSAWIQQMARVLAQYVVEKVRPGFPHEDYKPWDEF